MATGQINAKKDRPIEDPLRQPEDVVAEVVEAMLETDRAHHSELGRTVNGTPEPSASPREQPAAPIDIESTGE